MALLAGSMRVPRPATGMTALVTFGMWVPWCLLDAHFAGFCGSGPCPRIGPAGAAYAVLMFIGPPLAGIAGMARSYIAGFARLCGALPTAMDGGNAGFAGAKTGPAPQCKGRYPLANPSGPRSSCYSLRSPFGPAFGCYSRWSLPCLPNPIEHTRPRGIHAPTRSFGIIQTMLLALPNFGLERMGRNPPGGYAGKIYLARYARKTQNPKPNKIFRPQAAKRHSDCCGFSRPNRASPPLKKSGSHARRDAGQGSWYRMYLTIRGR